MRGWRRARSKARARDAARTDASIASFAPPVWPPAAVPAAMAPEARVEALPVEPPVEAPVEPPVEVASGESAAPLPAPGAAAPEVQADLLRLFEVVTDMCDHVIEYIESDRAERRLMLETLAQLGRVITDGAAATVAANAAQALGAPAETAPDIVAAEPAPEPRPARQRVIGGSMPAGPDPVIDLREAEARAAHPSAPRPEAPSTHPTEIAVEVRGRFGDRWVDGFEICEVMTTPEGPRYRLRRRRDGVVLPELFDATSIRHVETFEQLDGNGNGNGRHDPTDPINLSRNYWSRS